MSRAQIQAIQQAISAAVDLVLTRGQELSDEEQKILAQVIDQAAEKINELKRNLAPVQMPLGTELLWILAGGQPDAFVNYLRTIPDPALNQLLTHPDQLDQVLRQLAQSMPQGQLGSVGGIEHAPINSSNIYGFRYDPRTGRLLIRFQSGSVYGYNGVPESIFKIFQQGAVPAKTNGQNKFGKWWQGKIPSLGAAFYSLIRQGGYPYQKLS
jgi:hypothetical protein